MILGVADDPAARHSVRGWVRRQNKMEDIEWLLDQNCSGYDLERAYPNVTLHALERLAQRHNRYDLARRIHAVSMDKSLTAPGKPGPILYNRYKEAS